MYFFLDARNYVREETTGALLLLPFFD